MIRRTLPVHRMASTHHGMRRILKQKGSVANYIRQAVESGVYRTNEELAQVWKDRRESADDLRTVMRRFRQDIVRGSNIQDYPVEYQILQQHPPVPDPPRTPKRLLRKMLEEPNPTQEIVELYLQRQQRERDHTEEESSQEYYRRLFGIKEEEQAKASKFQGNMTFKSASLQKAYSSAIHHYKLQRTEGLTDHQAMEQVDQLLKQQDVTERTTSRQRASSIVREGKTTVTKTIQPANNEDQEMAQEDKANSTAATTLETIFKDNPRTLEAVMRWSERLQAVPYTEWTIGASTALDHWIARKILDISEETWLTLLEGDDHSLLSHGRDIVAVREALFPETQFDAASSHDTEHDEELEVTTLEQEKTVEELLASLGALNVATTATPGHDHDDDLFDAQADRLVQQLQDWRAKHADLPYPEWSSDDKDAFNYWLKHEYVAVLVADKQEKVDWDATRQALLSVPPMSKDASEAFWQQLEQVDDDTSLLAALRETQFVPSTFWDLPVEQQVQRLQNLRALRPLMDEYTSDSDRQVFVQRHAHDLMAGVPMEYLVLDPEGPITLEDLPAEARKGVPAGSRFRLELRSDAATERTRSLLQLWNQHKAGRAVYEERLFQTGRLGLRYSDDEKEE
jgi:hypothetical protein